MILRTRVTSGSCSTLPTLTRSLSTEVTPMAVLISVVHSEHSVTVMAEIRNDFWNIGVPLVTYTRADDQRDDRQPGQRRDRPEDLHDRVDRGLHDARRAGQDAQRHRDHGGQQEAGEHRDQAGDDLVQVGRLAGVGELARLVARVLGQPLLVALVLALVERVALARARPDGRATAPASARAPAPGRATRPGWSRCAARSPPTGPRTAPAPAPARRRPCRWRAPVRAGRGARRRTFC